MTEVILDLAGARCRGIYYLVSGVPIVFLHGYSFTSSVWQRINIIAALVEKHVPFLALDMPYGQKSDCKPKSRSTEININVLRAAVEQVFDSAIPFLVGASLGGHIALQYAARFPVKGLMLLGATRVFQGELAKAYGKFHFPVCITIGSKDRIASLQELRNLAGRLPEGELKVYENASHASYLDSSDRFKKDLFEFYTRAVEK